MDGVSPLMAGLYVNNNSTKATEIYKNTFEDLEAGIRCQSTNTKLEIKCNTFNNVMEKYDIYVTSGTLANQGKCLGAAHPAVERAKAPAGNIFNNTCTGSVEQHIKVLSVADPFIYFHHTDLAPLCYTTSKVTLNSCSYSSTALGEACPSTLTGGTESSSELLGEINSNSSEIEDMENAMVLESELESEETDLDALEYLQLQNEYLIQQLVEIYQQSSEIDSAILLLQSVDELWARQQLVEVYMLKGDYENAITQLKTLPTDELATQDFVSLMEVIINMQSDGRNLDLLSEKELAIIESIQGKQSPSGVTAENILQLINKTDIPEVFDVETAEEMRYANTEITSAIKVFPNPTDNALFIDLSAITESQIPVRMVIYNLIGNKISEQELQAGEIQKIALNNFSAGIYLLQCFQEDTLLHTENVMVE
ncbi:MAG TPA: T9SS type A sorting domain-containing protein [Chitinophagales bacterium]|nr:T9SS type A sorting domain-containing protein [Chitinophagales bacterium]